MDCTTYVAITKALIICAVTLLLVCAFFSHMQKAGFLMMQLIFAQYACVSNIFESAHDANMPEQFRPSQTFI